MQTTRQLHPDSFSIVSILYIKRLSPPLGPSIAALSILQQLCQQIILFLKHQRLEEIFRRKTGRNAFSEAGLDGS